MVVLLVVEIGSERNRMHRDDISNLGLLLDHSATVPSSSW